MSALPQAEGSEPSRVEQSSDRLLKSTSVVGSMTLLSRITGLLREVALAHAFGAGIVTDAWIVAFKIPNLLRRFFAEGAFSQVFVPVISEYRATRSAEASRELIDRMTGTMTVALLVMTAVGVVAAPLLIMLFGAGFLDDDDGRYELATDMLRFTFPYLFFISLTAIAGGILNSHRRFAIPAFTPVLLNLILITFTVWVAPRMDRPGLWLAIGVFVGGAAQLAFQVPFLARLGLLPRPRWGFMHAGVRRMLKLMVPIMFGSSVAQISIMLDTLIASFLIAGSISWLTYSDRLVEFPLGVFGIALATVILPRLSEHHALASDEQFSATLDWALRLVLVIALPAALGLGLLAEPLLAAILFGGAFTEHDVAMSAASLRAFAPGLIGFILVKVLAPGYFARQDTRTPVRIALRALLLGLVLNVAFVVTLLRTGWAPAHAGLAAATTCSGLFNAALLLAGLLKARVYRSRSTWLRLSAQVLAGCAAMSAFLLWGVSEAGDWLIMSRWQRAGMLAGLVCGGAVVYFAGCYLFGLRARALRIASTAPRVEVGP